LPYVVHANASAIEEKLQAICHYLDLAKSRLDSSFQQVFLTWLLDFRRELDIPARLGDIGIHTDDAIARQHAIGELAVVDPSAAGNPIPFTAEQYLILFQQAVAGDLPT